MYTHLLAKMVIDFVLSQVAYERCNLTVAFLETLYRYIRVYI